jgi:hypothetical protein
LPNRLDAWVACPSRSQGALEPDDVVIGIDRVTKRFAMFTAVHEDDFGDVLATMVLLTSVILLAVGSLLQRARSTRATT